MKPNTHNKTYSEKFVITIQTICWISGLITGLILGGQFL